MPGDKIIGAVDSIFSRDTGEIDDCTTAFEYALKGSLCRLYLPVRFDI